MSEERQPKGIPAGGQFAPDTRTEPTVALAAPAPVGPDLTDKRIRDVYVIRAGERLVKAQRELQQVYMIGAAQELREVCPAIDSFELSVDERGRLEVVEAWDSDGNPVDREATYAASHEVFRYRDEDDFGTFLDGQRITISDSIAFRPGN